MRIEVIMDSGIRYTIEHEDLLVGDFIKGFYNNMGILKNTLMKLGEHDIYINPSHISSIEVYDEKVIDDDYVVDVIRV